MLREATVEIVVTGAAWMGGGISSIETALRELVSSASRELSVVTYSISDGADEFLDLLESRLRDGVRITVIVERLEDQYGNAPARLYRLARTYENQFRLYDFVATDRAALHAKCIIADRCRALVGSANLSFNGLVKNHELAVIIEGAVVEDLIKAVERLPGSVSVQQVRS